MFSRNRSTSSVTPLIVLCVRRTNDSGSSALAATASLTAANTRPSHWCTPGRLSGPAAISFQSMSSSKGPANSIVSRIVSAPHRSTSGIGSMMLPFDFDIEAPS